MEGGEIVTIATFWTLKKQWTVAFVMLLLFMATLAAAARVHQWERWASHVTSGRDNA
jgi:hypothetical protein